MDGEEGMVVTVSILVLAAGSLGASVSCAHRGNEGGGVGYGFLSLLFALLAGATANMLGATP
jgi:hypothetical protein